MQAQAAEYSGHAGPSRCFLEREAVVVVRPQSRTPIAREKCPAAAFAD